MSSILRKKSKKLLSTPRSNGFKYLCYRKIDEFNLFRIGKRETESTYAPVESFKYPYLDLLIISLVVRFFAIK